VLVSTKTTQNKISKDTLEKRLAAIINPSVGGDKALTDQLTVVDSFLAEKGSKKVLKQAINFVKPFFLSMTDDLLKERARSILHGFNSSDNSFNVLEHYLLHRDYPDILDSGIIDKVMNYHELQHK
jgi:hypothetical protein